jgi:hypothetical protein
VIHLKFEIDCGSSALMPASTLQAALDVLDLARADRF